ncbi:hypothetical protein [Cupriavidus sp. amp6]|uniref:hypothetical protein n=1 Tax=Cupriavidus sp. amp6 TaxID=388051 RepID=UPI00040ACEB8|nr:hypothetical protein [Cupriavidus sp. amp6]
MFKLNNIEIEVGPVPAEESCAQVGRDDYSERSRRECAVYIRQLQRVFGNPDPASCGLSAAASRISSAATTRWSPS